MKFGQLMEYNMTNIFLEKSYSKCGRETISRPFSKKSKFSTSLDQYFKVLYILFYLFVKLRTIESDWKEAADHLLLPHTKLFKKQKEVWNYSLCLIFCMIFEEKYLLLNFITWSSFIVWLLLLLEILGNMCIVIVC